VSPLEVLHRDLADKIRLVKELKQERELFPSGEALWAFRLWTTTMALSYAASSRRYGAAHAYGR
jgi:hypothetical protein